MATTEQLQTWLSQAEEALHKLQTGVQTVEVTYYGRTVRYAPSDATKVQAYINSLELKLGLKTRSKAILARF